MSVSPLAARESADELRRWLAETQMPPQARAALEAEVVRLSALAAGQPTSLDLALGNALREVDRLTATVADRERQLAELVASAGAMSALLTELCAAIDRANAAEQFDGNVEMPADDWRRIESMRRAGTP